MKNFLLCIVLHFSIISCSIESESNKSDLQNTKEQQKLDPRNTANLFDNTGQEYYEIINFYNEKHGLPNDVKELTSQLREVNANVRTTIPEGSIFSNISNVTVMDMLRNPDIQFQQIMETHVINQVTKIKLSELCNMVLNANNQNLNILKNNIVKYEDAITRNENLQSHDKKMILSISSLARFIFLSESDRKDRDWEKSKTARNINNSLHVRQVEVVNFIVASNNLMISN